MCAGSESCLVTVTERGMLCRVTGGVATMGLAAEARGIFFRVWEGSAGSNVVGPPMSCANASSWQEHESSVGVLMGSSGEEAG